jgi:hypothetical protein
LELAALERKVQVQVPHHVQLLMAQIQFSQQLLLLVVEWEE